MFYTFNKCTNALTNTVINAFHVVWYDLDYNPGKNIWHKVKKSSKIGQDFKNLSSDFACFLTAIVKV